tara:strand:- start:3645 stop:5960 length:2316 start_codon:yes stop_codon:yes gene_type:complete
VQSIQQFGSTVEGIGREVLEEETLERDKTWVFEQATAQRKDFEAKADQLARDEGYGEYGVKMQKFAMEQAKSLEKDAPSERAKQMLRQQIRPSMMAGIANAAKTERVQTLEAQRKSVLDYVDSSAEEIAVKGDPEHARSKVKQAIDVVNQSKNLRPEEKTVLVQKAKNLGALNLANAMAESNPNRLVTLMEASVTGKTGLPEITPDQKVLEVDSGMAIKLMGYTPEEVVERSTQSGKVAIDLDKTARAKIRAQGDDQFGKLFREGLDAKQFSSVLRMAHAKAKQAAKKNLSNLSTLMKEGEAAASEGDVFTASKQSELIAKKIINSSELPDENKGRLLVQNEAGIKAFAQASAELNALGADEIDSFTARGQEIIDSTIAEAKSKYGETNPAYLRDLRQQLNKQLIDKVQDHKKKLQSDPMSIVRRSRAEELAQADGDEVKVVLSELVEEQKAKGVNVPRVTTLSQAREMAAELKPKLQSKQTAALAFEQLQEQYGDDLFPMVAKELGQQKGMPSDLMLLAYAKDPGSKAQIIDNIVNRTEIKERFISKDNSEKDLKASVRSAFPELERAFSGRAGSGENDATVNGVFSQLETATMRYINDGDSESDAREKAYAEIIGANFHVTDVDRPGIGGDDSNLLIPRVHAEGRPTNVKTIEAFMRSHHTARGLMQLGVDKFLKESGQDVDQQSIARAASEGEWVNNGPDGIVFVVPGQNFGLSGMVPVPGTEKSFQELSEGPFDRLTTDELGETNAPAVGSRFIPDAEELRRSSGGR